MDPRDDNEYLWLTQDVITAIEKQLNPGELAFRPPPSWACKQFELALKDAYKKRFPQAAYEPQYKGRAQEIAEQELNKILIMRFNKSEANTPIKQWRAAGFAEEPFSTIPIVGVNVGVGRPAPASYKKQTNHNPPATTTSLPTLPSQSQNTLVSSSTSVSTGRGTSTLNGNNGGSPLHQRTTTSPGPSLARGTNGSVRQRRGRGSGHRLGQPSGRGPHVCPWDKCGKSFQYPSKLKDHEHTHLTAKEFACTLGSCTKSFKRQRELKAHEKITHPGHPPESETGHPSESEVGDQEMPDVGESEPVEDQKKTEGRRDEIKTVDVEVDHKRKSPHIELHRPPNKIPEAEEIRSSSPTLDGRGATATGPKSPPSRAPERHPPPAHERHPSPLSKQHPSLTPERPPPSEPKQRPSQPPSVLTTSDPTLPAMTSADEPGPSQMSKPESRESKPQEIADKEAQIEKLAVNILQGGA